MNKTASATTERLIPIWQRVLQVSSVGVEDNFFDLGGDSALALELFDEISRAWGRDLPPVMIYHASTIAALGALLEEPSVPRVPALVQLKSGTSNPPVFITHGLGGTVMDFFQVLKHVRTPRAIHGMQAKGIDGVEEPFDSIEEMARYYLKAVRALQAHGPYLLIGYSLGGLVILEMAQRLAANGEKVALLAMLDSYPHIRRLSRGQRLRLAMQQMRYRISGGRSLYTILQSANGTRLSSTMQRVRDSAFLALERYQPRFYPGSIRFVRAAIPKDFPADPAAVWGHLAGEFVVETVPGDHLGIMTTHYEELANVLSRYLSEALPS
ncbi:MAG TPA: thioesterase domain-containing protein [Terriglobales bacterium]|nr:thioesterase domain-containing protein [Terriglobales bacterium]